MLVADAAFTKQNISHMAPSIIDKKIQYKTACQWRRRSKEIWMNGQKPAGGYFPHISMSAVKAFTMQTDKKYHCFHDSAVLVFFTYVEPTISIGRFLLFSL